MGRAIDLFAGAGGFTTGATQAGLQVVWAANHKRLAVDVHAANHPDTAHSCQDLAQANFTELPDFEVLLASPCCQGSSDARGKERPHHDAARSTAWAVVACVEATQPELLVVENVEGFLGWDLFPVWKLALETYGYKLTANLLDAADFGVPQNRERVFIVGSKTKAITIKSPELEHVPARSFIDLESGSWGPVYKPGRAASTIARHEAGRQEFGDEPFLAPFYGSGSGKKGRSLDRPIGTVTTRDRWGLHWGDRMRMVTREEYRAAMGFPEDYELATSRKKAIHLLGNAVCPPVAAEVIRQAEAA